MSQAKKEEPIIEEINLQQLEALKEKLDNNDLSAEDVLKLKYLLNTFSYIHHLINEKNIKIKQLRQLFSGYVTSEKSTSILKEDPANKMDCPVGELGQSQSSKKGHGRNGVSVYTGAQRKSIPHPTLQAGSNCPLCPAGCLYKLKPSVILRITGNAPLSSAIYEMERYRCSSCGAIFKAPLPPEAGTEKYDAASCANVCLLKYGNGFAFNRLEKFQENMGVPLSVGTQWEMVKKALPVARLVFDQLLTQAAQAEVLFYDDTGVKILSIERALKRGQLDDGRTGMFTTGIIAKVKGRDIALYLSGRNHAGENIEELLRRRQKSLGPPIQMSDAKSCNLPKNTNTNTNTDTDTDTDTDTEVKTNIANCLVHGRRNFVKLLEVFPQECKIVIEALAEVYKIDKYARINNLSPKERLELHQRKSKGIMDQLKNWLNAQFDERKVEPNSSLGGAIKYMQRHWEKLTRFLSVENAPLDNNVVEQSLKRAILNRKNAYFFKTENGARVGDIFMSIIQTCYKAKINVFDYLVKLQKHAKDVEKNVADWMPWNYQDTINKKLPFLVG
jgi:hypothetical protein